jgi:hypothetical protein
MDQNLLIPLLFFGGSQGRGAEVIKRTLPGTLSNPSQRFLLTALFAAKELKRQDETVLTIIQDVVTQDRIKDAAALNSKFPKLHEIFLKLPETVRATIKFPIMTPPASAPDAGRGKS